MCFQDIENLSRHQNKWQKKLLDFVFSTSQILFLVMKTLISLELLLGSFVREYILLKIKITSVSIPFSLQKNFKKKD